jgi:hypothetical protein
VTREEVKRWLKALRIAKTIFEDQGYFTRLDEVERLIRREILYTQKIKKEYVPMVLKISASKRIPMIQLVNQIIKDYLNEEERVYERKGKRGSSEHSPEV